jgi:hypothetical protein
MTPRRKRTPEEVRKQRELRVLLAELERIDALTDAELDHELREAGFDPELEVTPGTWLPHPQDHDKTRPRPRRPPWPWLAAACAIVVLVLAAMAAR